MSLFHPWLVWKTPHWVIELSKIVELSSCQERFGAKGVQILPYFMSFPMILSIFYPYPFILCPYYPIIDIIHILIYFIHIHLYIFMVFMIDVRLINLGFFPSTWHRNATFPQRSVKICSGQVIQGWMNGGDNQQRTRVFRISWDVQIQVRARSLMTWNHGTAV